MHRKAQAEIALILGLAVIAIFVAFYGYSNLSQTIQPAAMSEEQKNIEAYARDLLETLTRDAILTIYNQGGYYDTSGQQTVEYIGSEVPYWQLCGDTIIPKVETNLEDGITEKLEEFLPESIVLAGSTIEFRISSINTDVRINDDETIVTLNVPTKIDGVDHPSTYTIDIETNLGRIIDFAGDFSKTQAQYRMLDKNLLKLLGRSDPYGCWLPTEGIVSSFVFRKKWSNLRDCMEQLIWHTLTHTYEWQKPVLRDDGSISEEMLSFAFIPQIYKYDEGVWGQYVDLGVEFDFANGGKTPSLSKTSSTLLFRTHPDPVKFNVFIPFMPPITKYNVTYDVAFPVVMNVKDEKLNAYFRFANFVNIAENAPSETCDIEVDDVDHVNDLCFVQATRDSKITVTNYANEPLQHVEVMFDICDFGVTGPYGVISRKLPVLTDAVLEIFIPDDDIYSECVDTSDLEDKRIQMPLPKTFNVHYVKLTLQRIVPANPTSDLFIQIVGEELTDKVDVSMSMLTNECMTPPYILPVKNYHITADENTPIENEDTIRLPATSKYNATISIGGIEIFDDEFEIDYTEDDIYIYVPNMIVSQAEIEQVLGDYCLDLVTHVEHQDVLTGCDRS